MTPIENALAELASSDSRTEVSLEHSDWLSDSTPDEVEVLVTSFTRKYETYLSHATLILGSPQYSDDSDRARVDDWFPEAIRLTAWERPGGFTYLALVHHDQETPVDLCVGFITEREIADLMA